MSRNVDDRMSLRGLVTQRFDDTWVATFLGLTARGATESDALKNLAAVAESAARELQIRAVQVSNAVEPVEVIVGTRVMDSGDVCGQIICVTDEEILHETESRSTLDEGAFTRAKNDAVLYATICGYRVVKVSE